MNKKNLLSVIVIVVISLFLDSAFASPSFYDGKTIRIVVGYSAGGGYDTYARLISRHLAKHIQGNPAVIVENMTGAGSLISANYMYRVAKPDGLTIGHFTGGLFFNQVLQQPGVEFDARKFIILGAAAKEEGVYAFSKKSGITSMEKWINAKTPLKMGGVAPGSNSPDNIIRILKAALGLPIQLISGYKGSPEVRMAIEQGEIAGSALGWAAMRSTWRKSLDSGDLIVVLQAVPEPFPDLPKVPLAINYAKTEEARQLIEVGIHSPSYFVRPFVLPPGTPQEQTQVLTKAFAATLKDKDFLAEAEKANLDIDPVSVSELEKSIVSLFRLDNVMLTKLKDILFK